MHSYKRPLGRSITIGIIIFTGILCIALGILNYYSQRNNMYANYRDYIEDILIYVDKIIDDKDLQNCIETLEESDKYKETLLFMDSVLNEFNLHYLYVLQPRAYDDGKYTVFSVLSAEDDYGRYVTLDDNLWLGYESGAEDGYDQEAVEYLIKIMNQDEIIFFAETTVWGTDYTGAMALKDADGKGYAVLAADVDITMLNTTLKRQALNNFAMIVLLSAVYAILFLYWIRKNVTNPVKVLEQGVSELADRSKGQRDIDELKLNIPKINTDNEVGSLSKAITQMTENMQDYVADIIVAEEKSKSMKQMADSMRTQAKVDALTGVRNRSAYIDEFKKLKTKLEEEPDYQFGFCMIDLNFLKVINDTYGHKKGDEAIKLLSDTVCSVFSHSPVFRIGGDEFVVILKGRDYNNIDSLRAEFINSMSNGLEKEPWKHVSAAIGIAFYDKNIDTSADDTLKRADEAMYKMKKEMKACREDT